MVLENRMPLLPRSAYDIVTKAAYVRAGDEARHKARASTPNFLLFPLLSPQDRLPGAPAPGSLFGAWAGGFGRSPFVQGVRLAGMSHRA